MPTVAVYDIKNQQVGDIELNENIFGVEVNAGLLHQAVVMQLASQRLGNHATKTRGMVRGGGRKPWKQKGTGHARQGSTRSPQWTHGGVALGPKPRSYRVSLNKRVKRVALFSALSSKVAGSEMVVVDAIEAKEYNTRTMVYMLKAVGAAKKSLVVLSAVDDKVIKSFANIEGVRTVQWNTINVYDILNCDTLIVAKDAVAKIEEVYAR